MTGRRADWLRWWVDHSQWPHTVPRVWGCGSPTAPPAACPVLRAAVARTSCEEVGPGVGGEGGGTGGGRGRSLEQKAAAEGVRETTMLLMLTQHVQYIQWDIIGTDIL